MHLKQADGSKVAFTNITAEHLQSLLPKGGVKDRQLKQSWVAPSEEEGEEAAKGGSTRRAAHGPTFDDCVKQGGRITDSHKVSFSRLYEYSSRSDCTRNLCCAH